MPARRWKFLLDGQEPEVFEFEESRNVAEEFLAFCLEHEDGGFFMITPETPLDIGIVVGIVPLPTEAEKKQKTPRVQRTVVHGFNRTPADPT